MLWGGFVVSVITAVMLYVIAPICEVPWGFKTVYPYYFMGYVIANTTIFKLRPKLYILSILFAVITTLILIFLRYYYWETNALINKATHVILPIPTIYIIHYVFKRYVNIELPILTSFGKASLLIYLIHLLLIWLLNFVYTHFTNDMTPLYNPLYIIAMFIILIWVSYYIADFINKNRFLRRIILLK